jgi:hypothetical protein
MKTTLFIPNSLTNKKGKIKTNKQKGPFVKNDKKSRNPQTIENTGFL